MIRVYCKIHFGFFLMDIGRNAEETPQPPTSEGTAGLSREKLMLLVIHPKI